MLGPIDPFAALLSAAMAMAAKTRKITTLTAAMIALAARRCGPNQVRGQSHEFEGEGGSMAGIGAGRSARREAREHRTDVERTRSIV
jgi:hypothetical protein